MNADEASPIFLTIDEVLEIHRDQIERYGGSGDILDLGALESALAQPQATFGGQFLHGDVYEMAAVYLYHVAQNHPFADGNKRVATVAAIVFLAMNGIEFDAGENELEQLVMSVAKWEMKCDDVATFLRDNCD